METNECFVCGGNNFTIIDGAFVCSECGIQSQNVREELISFNDNIMTGKYDDMINKDHEITAGSQLEKEKKLLSWECFNLILLGLTKEMIELGAKPSLKVIVLQIWVRYLQCIEAAFTSKKFKKLPKLNTSIYNVDGEILYGIENLKKKILNSKTGIRTGRHKTRRHSINSKSKMSYNSNASSYATLTHKLRRLDRSKTDLNNDSIGLSDDVSLLQRSKKSSKMKIKLTKNIQKSLKEMPSKTNDLTNEESLKLFKSGRKCWNKLKYKEKKNMLTIKKLISIIRLANMINDDDIYLCDILRWVHEGHFHVNRVNLFLPENVVHGINLRNMIPMSSRSILNGEMTMLLNHLKIDQLPNIDFNKMVIRFCDELQLPSDFTHFVCKLVTISPPSIKFNHVLPDIEIEIIVYILFAAKFLLCLDGNAENLSSDFAEKVNRLKKENKQLFNWNDYVQFIECRNTVVSEFNYILQKDLYKNKISNSELFINDWNIIKSTLSIPETRKFSKHFRDDTEFLLKSLPDVKVKKSFREIPASTKPLSTTLKWIFDYYPMKLSVKAKQILEKDFTQTDILYLTDEKRIYDLAKKCGISLKVNHNKPLHYVKQKTKDSDTKTCKSLIDQCKIYLINEPTYKIKENENLDNLFKKETNTIYLGTGLNYWSLHINSSFFKKADATKISSVLKKHLPHSFLWFMHQCCCVINCPQSEAYLKLLKLEKKFSILLQSDETESGSEYADLLSNITL